MTASARPANPDSWIPERWVRDRLDVVRRDAVLAAALASAAHPPLATCCGENLLALLTLLTARFGDCAATGIVPAATALALVEQGCRWHDDVREDDRDGAPSRHNEQAIMTGDLLLVRALQIVAQLGPDAVRSLARAVAGSQEAAVELRQQGLPFSPDRWVALAAGRAGALLLGAVELGTAQASVAAHVGSVLREVARHLGGLTALHHETAHQETAHHEPLHSAVTAGWQTALDRHLAGAARALTRLPPGAPTDQLAGLVHSAYVCPPMR